MIRLRCAIYTRKSSEEGLDQSFNSLDAQREACEAYIASQKSEGWSLIHTRYDDGGWSGGSMERPALTSLLGDIAAGKVDVVIVYKVDRLTRSLADFARIVDMFDRHGVSFVSVTQAFNTTSSMGRLTLNVLLSFAQFEREVTGERIRDKIAASKAKGMWMGGYPPLGYDPQGRTLLVNEAEAEVVRQIFRGCLEQPSVYALRRELEDSGIRTKQATSASGNVRGGVPFSHGALSHLLANRLYVGEIVHKGKTYPGQHEAIVGPELFQAVQRKLAERKVTRRGQQTARAPLAGKVFDALGNRMAATYAIGRRGKRYAYYISPVPASRVDAGHVLRRIAASNLEEMVVERLRHWTERPAAVWCELSGFVTRVDLHRDALVVQLAMPSHEDWTARIDRPESWSMQADGKLRVVSPARIITRGCRTSRVEGTGLPKRNRPDKSLIAGLRRAHAELKARGIDMTDARPCLKDARGVDDPYLRKLSSLAFLAPDIQRAILEGRQPTGLTLHKLLAANLSLVWTEQRAQLGFD